LDSLETEVDRDDSITRIADIYRIERTAVQKDYSQWKSFNKQDLKKQEVFVPELKIRNCAELNMLTNVAVNMELYVDFRTKVEIKEIEDRAAKEIFIALEECIRYGETGMDEFLARISSPELREFIVERNATGEFSVNTEQFVADGIRKIEAKRLEHRKDEKINKLRMLKKSGSGEDRNSEESGLEARELLSEIMQIDKDLYQLKQGR